MQQNKGGDGIFFVLLIFLTAAAFFDYFQDRVPNALIRLGILTVLVGGLGQWIEGIAGGSLGGQLLLEKWVGLLLRTGGVFLVFFLLYRLGMIGAGDVKLFALSAAMLEKEDCIPFLLASMLFAGAAAAGRLILDKNAGERLYYFCSYVAEVARSRRFRLYLSGQERRRFSVHMAGPMLAGWFWIMAFHHI